MRLVLRDVEVPDAQGEVDGIEILERGRQERNVGRKEDKRERRYRFAQVGQMARRRSASFKLPSR